MRAKTIQILWHPEKEPAANSQPRPEPIFAVDFNTATGHLASCGQDREIKLWSLGRDADGQPAVEHIDTLCGHLKTVNVARFSPGGDILASGGDGGEILLWRPSARQQASEGLDGSKCTWTRHAQFTGHTDDVQDLSWHKNGTVFATGSIDHSVVVWDASSVAAGADKRPQVLLKLQNHAHYVQGVAWDPHGLFLATLSADRSCRVYGPLGGQGAAAGGRPLGKEAWDAFGASSVVLRHYDLPVVASAAAAAAGGDAAAAVGDAAAAAEPAAAGPKRDPPATRKQALFHDEAVTTFFRRLAFSPDGTFLALPAGTHRRNSAVDKAHNTTYLVRRGAWTRPAAHLPGTAQPTVAVRFCPVLFEPRPPLSAVAPVTPPAAAPAPADAPADAAAPAAESAAAAAAESAAAAAAPAAAGPGAFALPYRVVYAVATLDSVYVYDSGEPAPLAVICGALHCSAITDLAWTPDGQFLTVSSYDGYCSVVAFDKGELGTPVPADKLPPGVADCLPAAAVSAVAARAAAAQAAQQAAAAAAAAQPRDGAAAAGDAAAAGSAPQQAAQQPQQAKRRIAPVPVGGAAADAAAAAPRRITPVALQQPAAAAPAGEAPAPMEAEAPAAQAPAQEGDGASRKRAREEEDGQQPQAAEGQQPQAAPQEEVIVLDD